MKEVKFGRGEPKGVMFLNKGGGSTFVEFVLEKQTHFDRWLAASSVKDFEQSKDLILLDELKGCVTPNMRLYLEERRVEDAKHYSILLDEYLLTY